MNHRWHDAYSKDNKYCRRCGVHRERRTRKILMAMVNHPPWEVYKYESLWWYWFGTDIKSGSFKRPNCK